MSIVFYVNNKKTVSAAAPDNGLFLKADSQRAVILVHGLTGTPNEMRFLAGSLNRGGYSVICPRLAYHGEPVEILKNARWQDFYATVRETFIKAQGEYREVYLAGLSMSALLILLLAEEFEGKVAGVSCLSPTLFYDGWNTPWYKCFLPLAYLTPLKHFLYFKESPPYGIKNERLRALVHEYFGKARVDDLSGVSQYGYPLFPVTLLEQLNILVKYTVPRLGNIHTPVQLIQAKEDDMTSVKNSQLIYDRIKSKEKEIVLLNNSYHVITADQERQKVAQEMERFFNGIANAKGAAHERYQTA